MITNERQYRIAKAQLSRLKDAIDAFDIASAAARTGSAQLAKAELDALNSELEVLADQIQAYDALRSGTVKVLAAKSLEDLPRLLIQARIVQQLSQRDLARRLGLKDQQVQRYEAEGYVSASLRRLSEIASALQLNISEVAELRTSSRSAPKRPLHEDSWRLFPLKEMYRRNWFQDIGFAGTLTDAIADGQQLVSSYIQAAMPRRQPALLRSRARFSSEMNLHALWAWQCRVLVLAKEKYPATSYSRDLLSDAWLRRLATESRFNDGPKRAEKMLSRVGIPLVIEPHLPHTYLDGATFLLPDGSPVIGMTLRYDRLDNFWFVLFHELIHIIRHLRKGKLEDVFDDLESERDAFELEADSLAGDALIPPDKWDTAVARYVRSTSSINSLAQDLMIHPSIIAGRIRREADNYVILNELVGQGEVRKHFTDVRFAQ